MIVIAIIGILMSVSYTPYHMYSKRANLIAIKKEIAKTLYESRNMAIHGKTSSWNISVWVYLDKNNNKIEVYQYPYNNDINKTFTWVLLKSIDLDRNLIKIDSIETNMWTKPNNLLLYFNAISWTWWYYTNTNTIETLSNTWTIKLNLYYNNSNIDILKTNLEYIKKTNIVDY